jgi:spore coat protein U-like protein
MYFRLSGKHLLRLCASFAFLLSVISSNAYGATNVSCLVATGNISFSPYNPLVPSPTDNESGFVQIKCRALAIGADTSVSYLIGLSTGQGGQNNPWRKMSGGVLGEFLEYNLYANASRLAIWGDQPGQLVAGSVMGIVLGGGDASASPHTIYSRIPPRQRKAQGIYTDTIQITVAY